MMHRATRWTTRWTWLALLWAWSMCVHAADLTLDRILADPPLAGASPRGLKFSPDGRDVSYLKGKPDRSEQLDLWAFEIRSGKERLLVDSDELLGGRQEALSDEEKARRERLRIASLSGIVDYHYAADGRQLLFPLAGALYRYDLKSRTVTQLTRAEDGFVTDPKFSPGGRYVSFVRGQNLYALRLADQRLIALTSEGGGLKSYGMAEFVAQEEMDRLTGYWWAPDESGVAFFHVDETAVPVQRRFEIYADRAEVIEQRYPAAGTTNAAVGYGWVAIPADDAAATPRLAPASDEGYLARLEWMPGSKAFAIQRQSRDQRRLDLVAVRVADFSEQILLTETASTWVNLHNDLRFLRDGRFVWASERSGYKQLYLHAADGSLIRALTAGAGAVDQLLQVVEARDRLYYSASHTEDLQKHVYVARLDRGPDPTPDELTTDEGFHDAVFQRSGQYFLDTHSRYDQPPRVSLRDHTGRLVRWIEANAVQGEHPLAAYRAGLSTPEYGVLEHAGVDLRYRLIKPPGFDPARRWPVVVRVYGGPHVQVVNKAWDGRWGLFDQYLAQQGIVVFALDNRGSARRGKAFEDALYGRMGEIDVADQRAGLAWLQAQPWVDASRIGVHGWSYGGYMTLMLMAQSEGGWRCGVSTAPVSDWLLYDTHYTERYMDLPERNAEGYARGDVLNHLDGFAGDLLLIHGMADDNVLFAHATRVMSALQARGVDFGLMTYPGGKHGINASPAQRLHVYRQIAGHLRRCLLSAD